MHIIMHILPIMPFINHINMRNMHTNMHYNMHNHINIRNMHIIHIIMRKIMLFIMNNNIY